ncbi:probable ubiquitin-conjugating enzyme E2 33 [Miscanthus floridulus]|uniref:probable ubiquitin-conjugating enzyme E2 33 n=1 Tax=Miscanthus floridulus TaxID=154761 RepID=UPI00345B1ED8
MAEKGCLKRLQKEDHTLCKEPPPQIVARPLPNDILEWHYVLEGSKGTPIEGGYYYGKLKFPPDYPFKPPSICMTTPSGRFAPHKRICMSMSDFHPESWNPMWSVARYAHTDNWLHGCNVFFEAIVYNFSATVQCTDSNFC